jgi:arylsulfatase A-like enzyme
MHRDRGFAQGFDEYRHGDQLRRALEFLDARHLRPFFLFFHTYEVHDPYAPPPDASAGFVGDPVPAITDAVAQVRAGVGGWPQAHRIFWTPVDGHDARHVRHVSDLYDAGIRRMDDTTLTALLDALDRRGLADDTLVVFTSDHGEAFQEHGRFLHDDLHAETLHVPLVLRLPGRLPAGRRVQELAGLVDLMPTVLELVGLPSPAQAQGRSLAMLAAGDGPAHGDALVMSEYSVAGRRYECARTADGTLIRDDDTVTAFDRRADPGERSPLAVTPAFGHVQALLDNWHQTNQVLAARLGPRRGIDLAAPSPETVDQLRALGYVE